MSSSEYVNMTHVVWRQFGQHLRNVLFVDMWTNFGKVLTKTGKGETVMLA